MCNLLINQFGGRYNSLTLSFTSNPSHPNIRATDTHLSLYLVKFETLVRVYRPFWSSVKTCQVFTVGLSPGQESDRPATTADVNVAEVLTVKLQALFTGFGHGSQFRFYALDLVWNRLLASDHPNQDIRLARQSRSICRVQKGPGADRWTHLLPFRRRRFVA